MLQCLKVEAELSSEMLCFFKKLDDGKTRERKDCISYLQLCSVLSLFTHDDMVMLVMLTAASE